jgi:hypothetical protein
MVDYKDLTPDPVEMPLIPDSSIYIRPPISDQTFIPDVYPRTEVEE